MPAYKPIRRTQLISPFGVGAMVNFPMDESLMVAGLDVWPWAHEKCPTDTGWVVYEERLQARLGVDHFRLPPDYREPSAGESFANMGIPFVRFPQWHYCHRCGGMEKLSLFHPKRSRCQGKPFKQMNCSQLPEFRRPVLMPVRFIAVCRKGHIQDFPFMEWVHRNKPAGNDCRLRLRAGRSSAGLSGIVVECTCGAKRSMSGVFEFDEIRGGALHRIGVDCGGHKPWLGDNDDYRGQCGEYLRVLQRGASNVYFPQVVSSIYLPYWSDKTDNDILKALADPTIWEIIKGGTNEGRIDFDRIQIIAKMRGLDAELLMDMAQKKLDGGKAASKEISEESYRLSEYKALKQERFNEQAELLVAAVDINKYSPSFGTYFSQVSLIRKLRETRALAGFTRLLPPDGKPEGTQLQALTRRSSLNWLPATVVRGEGIFFELKEEILEKWLDQADGLYDRIKLITRTNPRLNYPGLSDTDVNPRLLLLHTLSHLLINQLSFDCGYGSASIRERIYCSSPKSKERMCGFLIYTASGDSEGTMGGLVRQGEPGRLEPTLRRALRKAKWCSSDPVCIESIGQGPDSANLAACHSCALLPETSCEFGNRVLDRAVIVGLPANKGLGFFCDSD